MTCKHDWEFQAAYSNVESLRRFKCRVCGCWGYQQPPNRYDGFKQKVIHEYTKPDGGRFEPEEHWLQPDYRERTTWPTLDAGYKARQSRVMETGRWDEESDMEEAVYGSDHFVDPGEI